MMEVGKTHKYTCPECGKEKTGFALYGSKVVVRCCGKRKQITLKEPRVEDRP